MAIKYVSQDTGNDSNDGDSEATAYATVAKVLDNIVADDTVLIYPSATPYVWSSKTLPVNITIKGTVKPNPRKEFVKIDASGTSSAWVAASYLFENIWFANQYNTSSSSPFRHPRSTLGDVVKIFRNCLITDFTTGSFSSGGRNAGLFGGSEVGGSSADTITLVFDRCVFYNFNTSSSSNASAIVYTTSGNKWDITFTRCTIYFDSNMANYPVGVLVTDDNANSIPIPNYVNTALVNTTGTDIRFCSTKTVDNTRPANVTNCTYYGFLDASATVVDSQEVEALFLDPPALNFNQHRDSPTIFAGKRL